MNIPARPGRVLFLDQTAEIGGAERSLLDLLDGLPRACVAGVASPRGPLSRELDRRGIAHLPAPAVDLSFRLHAVHTTKGAAALMATGRRVRGLARVLEVDLVHANTTRAGLAASVAGAFGGPPTVLHVRDWLPEGRLGPMAIRAARLGAGTVVANSGFTAAQLPRGGRAPVRVVHNPVDLERFDPERVDRVAARSGVGVPVDATVLTVAAQLTPWKGQADAIRVLAQLLPRWPKLRLMLAGSAKWTHASTRFDNERYARELRELAGALGVRSQVMFLGERKDIPEVLRATDVLLVPSWREAFGRIAVEGMAMGIPVAVTTVGGPAEIVRDGEEGLVLPPRAPERWAQALEPIIADPTRRERMGRAGAQRARREFGIPHHVEQILSVYREVAPGRRWTAG